MRVNYPPRISRRRRRTRPPAGLARRSPVALTVPRRLFARARPPRRTGRRRSLCARDAGSVPPSLSAAAGQAARPRPGTPPAPPHGGSATLGRASVASAPRSRRSVSRETSESESPPSRATSPSRVVTPEGGRRALVSSCSAHPLAEAASLARTRLLNVRSTVPAAAVVHRRDALGRDVSRPRRAPTDASALRSRRNPWRFSTRRRSSRARPSVDRARCARRTRAGRVPQTRDLEAEAPRRQAHQRPPPRSPPPHPPPPSSSAMGSGGRTTTPRVTSRCQNVTTPGETARLARRERVRTNEAAAEGGERPEPDARPPRKPNTSPRSPGRPSSAATGRGGRHRRAGVGVGVRPVARGGGIAVGRRARAGNRDDAVEGRAAVTAGVAAVFRRFVLGREGVSPRIFPLGALGDGNFRRHSPPPPPPPRCAGQPAPRGILRRKAAAADDGARADGDGRSRPPWNTTPGAPT